eukprot:GHUV01001661.1.p2 GENE.GHUV01001661.1~~GHUV01001661.1.p2  ORF type:complete len:117 (-),score=11.57 GHUV01001661.1:1883-2233(-)
MPRPLQLTNQQHLGNAHWLQDAPGTQQLVTCFIISNASRACFTLQTVLSHSRTFDYHILHKSRHWRLWIHPLHCAVHEHKSYATLSSRLSTVYSHQTWLWADGNSAGLPHNNALAA